MLDDVGGFHFASLFPLSSPFPIKLHSLSRDDKYNRDRDRDSSRRGDDRDREVSKSIVLLAVLYRKKQFASRWMQQHDHSAMPVLQILVAQHHPF